MALDWKIFTQRPYIKSLPLEEQTRLFFIANEKSIRYRSRSGTGPTGPTFTNNFSLNFDGINDSAINNDATFNITNAFSISAWIKTDTNGQSSDIIFFAGDGSNSRYGLDMEGAGGRARFVLKTSAGISRISFTESIIDNEWHHLLGTWDGTTMRLYLDGDLNTSGINNGTLGSQDSIMIGSWVSGTQLLYQGFVDEAAIFTSTLSAEEVATVYNNGIAGDISSLNPVAWYRLEEGSGTTVINSGTGGNNLTRTGATYSTDVPG